MTTLGDAKLTSLKDKIEAQNIKIPVIEKVEELPKVADEEIKSDESQQTQSTTDDEENNEEEKEEIVENKKSKVEVRKTKRHK